MNAPRPWAGAALVILFGLIQFVPFGRSKNPPVTKVAQSSDPAGVPLVAAACADCHSNLTKRWWATKVAPVSWLAQNDITGGRSRPNFSEWDRAQPPASSVIEAVGSGSMPPLQYKIAHSDARLNAAQRQQLIDAITQLCQTDPPASIRQNRD